MSVCDISFAEQSTTQSWRRPSAKTVVLLLFAVNVVGLMAIGHGSEPASQASPAPHHHTSARDSAGGIQPRFDAPQRVEADARRPSASRDLSVGDALTPSASTASAPDGVAAHGAGGGGSSTSGGRADSEEGGSAGSSTAAPPTSLHGALARAIAMADGSA
jgi:hypothetical protein